MNLKGGLLLIPMLISFGEYMFTLITTTIPLPSSSVRMDFFILAVWRDAKAQKTNDMYELVGQKDTRSESRLEDSREKTRGHRGSPGMHGSVIYGHLLK